MVQSSESQAHPGGGGRLLNTFLNRPVEDHSSAWSDLWDAGESNLWDRGKPSPALIDLVEQQTPLLSPLTPTGRRKRALVPGCGRGYDVVMLALHGFDACGLEISETAVQEARRYAADVMARPPADYFGAQYRPPSSPGSVTFVKGDFLNPAWSVEEGADGANAFDLVYDYTFLCALHPRKRPDWAVGMSRVIKSQGLLVCLEFPMYKDPRLAGPPWGLKGVHWNLLVKGGNGEITGEVADDGKEKNDCDSETGNFQRLLYIKPPRSYEVARGTDMISVYIRK
ncbi:hypothetical protein PDE_05654 [Penicillium oxalicum 114-2]|uniref:Methyltransferase domain-containing protein n=1 Tax=Penicillium oxalicum (strain 114-2 / CGMCC 5302) TaxID=933388 RepID=S8B7K0_PENO1|nr:hypothetical protein PDE_05654 [Penicillium oxalicum 114-2]